MSLGFKLSVPFDRCVVRYGYKDIHKDDHKFEDKLLQSLGKYILMEDDAEEEGNGFDDGADGKMHLPGIQSSSLVHAVNNDGASKERFGKGKESSGNSKVQLSMLSLTPSCRWLESTVLCSPKFFWLSLVPRQKSIYY